MAITFLDEEEEIVPVAPKKTGKRRITFLDEEEPLEEEVVKPEPEVLTTSSGRKITFLDEEPEAETPAPVGTSFIEELAAIPQAIKQSIDQPLEAMGETAQVLGASGIGGALRGAVEGPEDYVPAAQRFMEPQEGEFRIPEGIPIIGGFAPQFLPRAIVEQAGQIGGAMLTRAGGAAVGGLAGSVLGPKGTVAGAVAGQFIGPALFEMGQIVGPVARERAANQGREEPTTDDLAWAWATAGASGALNAIGAKYIPGGDKLTGSLAKKISTALVGEGSTEGAQSVVQQTGQTFLTEQGFEIKPKEVVGETILGGGAAGTAVVATAPFTKAAAAAETKVVAEQASPIAPETAQAVSEQANRVIQDAQTEETQGEPISVPATVGPLAIREGETQEDYQARMDILATETPDEKVARLQREAQEGVGIDLEEEVPVSGLPPVEPTPPVTPTVEGAVAPVEPVVPAEGAVEPVVTEVAPTPEVPTAVEARPKVTPEERIAKLDRLKEIRDEVMAMPMQQVAGYAEGLSGLTTEEAQKYSALMMEAEGIRFDIRKELDVAKIPTEKERDSAVPAPIVKIASDELVADRGVFDAIAEAAAGTFFGQDTAVDKVMSGENPNVSPSQFYNTFNNTREALREKFGDTIKLYRAVGKQKEKATQNWHSTKKGALQYGKNVVSKDVPIDDIVALNVGSTGRYEEFIVGKKPASELAPTPEPPALAPLRRVAKAEQTEEDVSGLVGQGLVELYNGQPVITQAGLDALPEAERPRLTPEARKIQIDTRTSEAAAEAISKNLRIGVDQVPVDVRMPAGWTIEGDIYIPPVVEAAPEVRESRRETKSTFKITADDAKELQYKIGTLLENTELQSNYGLNPEQTKLLYNSIPSDGGNWEVPSWANQAVKGELEDQAKILGDMADDARGENRTAEALRMNKQAKRLKQFSESISVARESRREPAVPQERFYSQLQRTVEAKMPNVSSPEQLRAIIDPTRGSGVKPEEVKWSGITEAIDRIASENNGRVPKEEILKYMRDEGRVRFEEVRMSDAAAQNEMRLKRFRDSQKVMRDAGIFVDVSSTGEVLLRDKYSGPPNVDPENLPTELRREYETLQDNAIEDRAAERLETRYSKYQLEEGTNYREIVMAMPSVETAYEIYRSDNGKLLKTVPESNLEVELNESRKIQKMADNDPAIVKSRKTDKKVQSKNLYTSTTHYPNVPNYVAHMRLNDRKDSDGRDGTFIEEIQSDRHQAGREKGYREDQIGKLPKNWSVKQRGESWIVVDEYEEQIGPLQSTEEAAIQEGISQANFNDINVPSLESGGIPDAPFRKDWPLQMFKRALEEAVASGKEWIGWTTGETQADRYDLSKQVDSVNYDPFNKRLIAVKDGQRILEQSDVPKEKLADYIGKDAASKLLQPETLNGAGNHVLSGSDLRVGGEGMKGFYDTILPKEIAKYVKKWGATVEKSDLYTKNKMGTGVYVPIWRVNITPEMRRIIEEEGQPVFSLREAQPTVGMTTDAVRTRLEALGFGVEGMIRIVEDPQAAFEGRTIIQDGKAVRIELNASALNDNAAIDRVLNHEFAEAANADGALNKLVERLTPKEKKEINDAITRLGYEENVRTTEEAARAIEALAAGWKGRGFFERAVARVEAWGSKLGLKLTRRAAEYIAARNLAEVNENVRKWHISDALANLNGARRVNFNGFQAVLIPPSQMREAYSIAAYHGTPHEIKGKFQLAKIGTGEGATVYGWGLYFAENISVALEYKNRLAREERYDGSEFDDKNPFHLAAGKLASGKMLDKTREQVIADLEDTADIYSDNIQRSNLLKKSAQILRENKEAKIERIGNLYNVDLDVTQDQLMDWDKPLSEQNPEVRKKLEPFLPPYLQKPFEQKTIRELMDEDPTIQYIYRYRVMEEMDKTSFLDMFRTLSKDEREFRAKQKVSEAFRNAGIIGIRYLDQGSRFAQPKRTGFGWLVDDYRGSNYFKTEEEAIKFAEEAQTRNYVIFDEDVISITGRNGQPVDIRESRREPASTFTEESPEAKTLSNLKASMDKVDAASEAKGGKPTTQKVSEIAANWMEQGGDERALQDAITENTNLSPVNAAKVAKVIARQYDKQQQIAEAVLETEAGAALEGVPEGMEIPKDVDPKNKRTVLQRVIDATTGVRVKPVILQVPEKTALKEQIRLKARETREAKKAQQETADAVVEAIKALELRGPMRAKQAQALAKRAAKVLWTSEKSMENFMAYAERVMANTNYDADLREAKAAQKRAKELSKRDSIAAPQRETLEAIGNIGINLLNDPREFADVVNHYLRSFKPVVSEAYVVVPDKEMKSYLSAAEDVVNDAKAEFEIEDNERLADKYGITIDELKKYMDAEEIVDALARYAKREVIEGILNEKSSGVKEALKGVDTTILKADQRKLIDSMRVIDVKSLDAAEKQAYIRIGNNIIFNNNQTNGAEFFVATAQGQQAARDLAKNTEAMTKNKAWSNIIPALGSRRAKKVLKAWAEDLQSVADTFRNAFGKEGMTVFYEAMGMVDLDLGFTKAARTLEEIQIKMEKFYKSLDKKYKGAATNQDGILSEGIVGYLIQNVPEKGEADSLVQRRGLLQQDVEERRKSGDEDRMQMADRIQQLMQKLDGETVDQILANLKREYPANYESLTWLKDELFPQYKDFLKQFDENFNDQANNYNTPNYLPIVYSNISPSIDLLQGKKKYYDSLSSAPKQSSYTIKRSDYAQLPLGDDGRKPKEIGLNLRKNAYNSLSDQITRANTNPARQRIYSFLKTPESEEALGGAANRDFFAERIERLMESRERRGSFNKNTFEKAVDVLANLGRDIGTRIALAGSYQLIRQPADQVTVAIGVTGRADLMAKHLDPRQIKAARPVIDLFSIGRRGDASSGYKYINQMEGAQSRLERYYTEGNWVKAKEAAKNFADKFMAPLKVSDFTVAAATWMTFYRANLAKNGTSFTTWEDAAKLIQSNDVNHRRAAAYAENMTDIYQGSSDPTKMAVFAQKGKTGPENALKAILVPFNSFGVQFRSRISSELTEIFTRSGDWRGKAVAVKDLGATIGGTIMFGLAKRFVLPAITYGGVQILYSIFGVDVEEPDEEKKKEEFELKWRQLQGDIISTMIVGGGGQMLESYTIDGMNYLKYMIDSTNGSEDVLDDDGEIMSFGKYAKERAPFYRYRSFDNAMSLGIFDIGMDQAKKSILNTKMVLTPEEMDKYTPEEQRFLYVALLSDWLYLGGFNDADFARMWDKGRRDMIKARKEEEKEIKAIRSGR